MTLSMTEARFSAAPSDPTPQPATPAAPAARADSSPPPFARVLARLGEASAQGEAQVGRALEASKSGEALSPAELLSLQAGVYRYGEVVDLASRLIDRAQTGVKTVLQGQ